MINFQDFFPEMIQRQNFPGDDKYENFNDLLVKLNQWLEAEKVKPINIETVVLRDPDPKKARFLAEEPFCYQFVRVWYEENNDNTVTSDQ